MEYMPSHISAQGNIGIDNLSNAVWILRAVSDKTRLRIVSLLGSGEQSVCDLAEALQLAQPTVSRHLAYLKRARLIVARREANRKYYWLAHPDNPFHEKLMEALQYHFDTANQFITDAQRLQSTRHC